MTKLLVVYNTCGISKRENVEYYCRAIDSLLTQEFEDFEVVLSSCLNSRPVRNAIHEEFGDQLSYNFIDEILPVNVTFNHSVLKGIEKHGQAEGYVYVDSGITFTAPDQLQKLYDAFKAGPRSMVAAQTDTDAGLLQWFGLGSHHHDTSQNERLFNGQDFIIPIGKTVNLHVQLFSNQLFESYGHRIIPDIFAGYCTESVFSFLAAALKTHFVLSREVMVHHVHGMDGGSSGFGVVGRPRPWEHPFRINSVMERVTPGQQYGLGYEECSNILMHPTDKFDSEGFATDPQLAKFIKENLYLTPKEFDYGKITSTFS